MYIYIYTYIVPLTICKNPHAQRYEVMRIEWHADFNYVNYRKTSNIRSTLGGNQIVDHSDVVGDLTSGFQGCDKESHKTV